MPTCRTSEPESAVRSPFNASSGLFPALKRSRARGPYEGSTKDWVATAPTPASAHDTTEPTENQWDWTATPICPVSGSRATIENVWTGRTVMTASFDSSAEAGQHNTARRQAIGP